MFRDPWFRIIDVTESRGRSLADIAKEISEANGFMLERVRSGDQSHKLAAVRKAIYQQAKRERPDLTSSQIGNYMRKQSSTVRHAWREMGAA